MHRALIFTAALVALAVASVATAEEFREYFEFRYVSGLPGSGSGVTPDGRIGFDGAMQMAIPIGYTPGAGNYMISGSSAAIDGGFPRSAYGKGVNGTLAYGLGLFNEHALWVSDMGTGKGHSMESAYNAQFQIARETGSRPGISVGVIDGFNNRASNLSRPFAGDARSVFAVATRQAGSTDHPLYYTLGIGNGRFRSRPFCGVSYTATPRFKVFGEYDGFNPNLGVGWDALRYKDDWHAIVLLGLVDMDRINFGVTLTRGRPR